MALFKNRIEVLNAGSSIGEFFTVDAQTNLTATAAGETAELDATGGGGGDHTVVGGSTVIYKQTTEAVTSSATLQTDDELTVSVVSGREYTFEFHLWGVGNGAGGMHVAVGGTSTASEVRVRGTALRIGTTSVVFTGQDLAYDGSGMDTMVALTASTSSMIIMSGALTCSGNGTFALRWCQSASDGSSSDIEATSWMRITRTA